MSTRKERKRERELKKIEKKLTKEVNEKVNEKKSLSLNNNNKNRKRRNFFPNFPVKNFCILLISSFFYQAANLPFQMWPLRLC